MEVKPSALKLSVKAAESDALQMRRRGGGGGCNHEGSEIEVFGPPCKSGGTQGSRKQVRSSMLILLASQQKEKSI